MMGESWELLDLKRLHVNAMYKEKNQYGLCPTRLHFGEFNTLHEHDLQDQAASANGTMSAPHLPVSYKRQFLQPSTCRDTQRKGSLGEYSCTSAPASLPMVPVLVAQQQGCFLLHLPERVSVILSISLLWLSTCCHREERR